MRDWTGDYKSIYVTLGASNHSDKAREANDYYATAPSAIDGLLSAIDLPKRVWECACGAGHLSERLKDYGKKVYSTDLVERGYGIGGIDFLASDNVPHVSCILTNPPYRYALDFVLHALDILPHDGIGCFFLKTTFLEGKRRHAELFSQHPPKYVLQFSSRVLCAKNGDFAKMRAGGGSAVSYAWFVWAKGYKGDTVVRWI